jgi:hypothetical protein
MGKCIDAKMSRRRWGAKDLAFLTTGLAAGISIATILVPGTPANAATCGLSLNDDNATINTVGGANSGGTDSRLACGVDATATGANSTAVGWAARAEALNTAAFGAGALALGANATAIGRSSGPTTAVVGATTIGASAGRLGAGVYSTAIGSGGTFQHAPIAAGDYSLAIGGGNGIGGDTRAQALSDRAIAIGTTATVSGGSNNGVVLGAFSTVTGTNSVAVGPSNTVTGNNSGAFGTGNVVNGHGSFAIGDPNVINGNDSHAFGNNNTIDGDNSIAIGNANTVSHDNAAAFGNGVTTTRDNQQVFGTAANTYTMSGVASAASRTAQGTPTHIVTSNADGELAAHTFAELGLASAGDLNAINARLDQIGGMTGKAMTGVAMAFAMAGTPGLMPHEKFAISMNYGTFEGRHGVAFNTALRLHDNVQFTAGVGYGVNDRLVGGRAGLRFGW